MKKIIFCLITAAIFYGCMITQPVLDGSMPKGETCLYECEISYEQCKMGCIESLDGFGESSYKEQCKFNCEKDLNGCNAVCREN
ncbi:hypothetical protein BMS3Bbin09_01557 [bacterium BMS3Bbin09]|nr:hypothetical protein BMS3Bbin09_01557 [bacterium BMS3Bbin09]